MNELLQIAYWAYNYCTDFVINAANILNLSYYEVNFILFIIGYPTLIFGTALLHFNQRRRLRKMIKFNGQRTSSMSNEQTQ